MPLRAPEGHAPPILYPIHYPIDALRRLSLGASPPLASNPGAPLVSGASELKIIVN